MTTFCSLHPKSVRLIVQHNKKPNLKAFTKAKRIDRGVEDKWGWCWNKKVCGVGKLDFGIPSHRRQNCTCSLLKMQTKAFHH